MDKINLGGFPFTIAFSGGCFSGKTSTMEALKYILEKEGYKVVIISEAMRETEAAKSGMSIDAIRQDANLYFKLQKEIIQKKINQEFEAFNGEPNTIYLFDRAITDSLFYYEFYVDKSKLDNKEEYFKFHKYLLDKVSSTLNQVDLLIEFKPLNNRDINVDKMRPAYLSSASYLEFACIYRLNNNYRRKFDRKLGYYMVDLNDKYYNNCVEQIINKIRKVCQAQER